MEECEEICCICEVTFRSSTEYSSHLENEWHVSKLVENGFLSLKIANLFKKLLALYNDKDCACITVDFESFVTHLKCPIVGRSLTKCASTMTEPHVSSALHDATLPCAQVSGSEANPIGTLNERSESSLTGAISKSVKSSAIDRTKLQRSKHQKHLVKQFYNSKINSLNNSVSNFNDIVIFNSGFKHRKPVLPGRKSRLSKDKTENIVVPMTTKDPEFLPESIDQTDNCLKERNENAVGEQDASSSYFISESEALSPIIRGKTLSDCSFNRPVLSGYQKEDSYAFFIYQCSTCKALIGTSNIESHFSSVHHLKSVVCIGSPEKISKKVEVNCLACNVLVKGASQLVRHKESENHLLALINLAVNPRKVILDVLELLKTEKQSNQSLQPQLQSLRSFAFTFSTKINKLFHLYKLIAVFHKDSNSILDVSPEEELKLIPELNFYLEHARKNLIPETFAMFKGIFMCTVCGSLFGNLFTLANHVLVEINHVMKSSFKSPSISCLLCENIHNVASINLLLQTHRKLDLSSGAKSQCIWAEKIPPDSKMIEISNHLEATSSLDLKQFTGSYRCNLCCDEKTNESLFEAYRHIFLLHFSSTGAITNMNCLCCYQTFSSFSFLLRHAFENHQSLKGLKNET